MCWFAVCNFNSLVFASTIFNLNTVSCRKHVVSMLPSVLSVEFLCSIEKWSIFTPFGRSDWAHRAPIPIRIYTPIRYRSYREFVQSSDGPHVDAAWLVMYSWTFGNEWGIGLCNVCHFEQLHSSSRLWETYLKRFNGSIVTGKVIEELQERLYLDPAVDLLCFCLEMDLVWNEPSKNVLASMDSDISDVEMVWWSREHYRKLELEPRLSSFMSTKRIFARARV